MAPFIITATGTHGQAKAHERAARQAAAQLDASIDALTTGWSALTAAQKTEALRAGLVLALRCLKVLARHLAD